MNNQLYKTIGDLKIIRDTRFLGDLQMVYRVERNSEVLGFVRKVNHGPQRWIGFFEDGERASRSTSLTQVAWNFAH